MLRVMNFNMITLKDVENFVNKFPELELIHKNDYYGKTQYYCVMKELPNIVVLRFHYNNASPYIFLYNDIPVRVNSEKCKIYRLPTDVPSSYGHGYFNLNELEKPLKKVVFMFSNLILVQKKMKMYEKKLDVEKDFKE